MGKGFPQALVDNEHPAVSSGLAFDPHQRDAYRYVSGMPEWVSVGQPPKISTSGPASPASRQIEEVSR
jgi:hypothetical protein